MKTRRPKLLESDIQRQISEFLELDGWRALRTDPCSDRARGKGFGEVGMADHLYIRYPTTEFQMEYGLSRGSFCQVLWIEHKRPDGRASDKQKQWHMAERARGALTLIAGEDFEPSLDGFLAWYHHSGLMIKRLSLTRPAVER